MSPKLDSEDLQDWPPTLARSGWLGSGQARSGRVRSGGAPQGPGAQNLLTAHRGGGVPPGQGGHGVMGSWGHKFGRGGS